MKYRNFELVIRIVETSSLLVTDIFHHTYEAILVSRVLVAGTLVVCLILKHSDTNLVFKLYHKFQYIDKSFHYN